MSFLSIVVDTLRFIDSIHADSYCILFSILICRTMPLKLWHFRSFRAGETIWSGTRDSIVLEQSNVHL